jgi:hypothetical protein
LLVSPQIVQQIIEKWPTGKKKPRINKAETKIISDATKLRFGPKITFRGITKNYVSLGRNLRNWQNYTPTENQKFVDSFEFIG